MNSQEIHWVIVLGMHRSGTSALAGELHHQGVNFGENFIDEIETVNQKGFYEHKVVVDINEEILHYFGLTWFDCFKLADLYKEKRKLPEYLKQKIRDFFCLQEFSNSKYNGIKDPRISILLPFWLEVMDELGIRYSFIIMNRNPSGIVASLYKRDRMSKFLSELLWRFYLNYSIKYTNTKDRVWVDFSDFMSQPVDLLNHIYSELHLDLYCTSTFFVDSNIPSNKNANNINELYKNISDNDDVLKSIDWGRENSDLEKFLTGYQTFIDDAVSCFYSTNEIYRQAIENGALYTHATEVISEKDKDIERLSHELSEKEEKYNDIYKQCIENGDNYTHATEVISEKDKEITLKNQIINSQVDKLEQANAEKAALQEELDRSLLYHLVRSIKKVTG